MPQDVHLDLAIDAFYEGCAVPALLPKALDQIARAMKARGCMIATPILTPDRMPVSRGLNESSHAFFEEGWYRDAVRTERGAEWSRRHGYSYVCDSDLFSDEERRDLPYFRGFANKYDVPHFAASILVGGGSDYVALSFNRRAKEGAFTRSDVRRFNLALPRLRRAARIGFHKVSELNDGIVRSFDLLAVAAFLLDRHGRIFGQNMLAAQMIGRDVNIRQGRLTVADGTAQAEIDTSIAEAVSPPGFDRGGRISHAHWVSDQGATYFDFQAIPVRGAGHDVFQNAVAVGLLRQTTMTVPPSRFLQNKFGLTNREADVAVKLAEGLTLRSIAQELGLTLETVRYYSKIIYQKSSTGRQAAFVRLAALMIGAAAPKSGTQS